MSVLDCYIVAVKNPFPGDAAFRQTFLTTCFLFAVSWYWSIKKPYFHVPYITLIQASYCLVALAQLQNKLEYIYIAPRVLLERSRMESWSAACHGSIRLRLHEPQQPVEISAETESVSRGFTRERRTRVSRYELPPGSACKSNFRRCAGLIVGPLPLPLPAKWRNADESAPTALLWRGEATRWVTNCVPSADVLWSCEW